MKIDIRENYHNDHYIIIKNRESNNRIILKYIILRIIIK